MPKPVRDRSPESRILHHRIRPTHHRPTSVQHRREAPHPSGRRRPFEANRCNWLAYRDALAGIPGLRLMPYDETERNNWQYVILEVDPDCRATRSSPSCTATTSSHVNISDPAATR